MKNHHSLRRTYIPKHIIPNPHSLPPPPHLTPPQPLNPTPTPTPSRGIQGHCKPAATVTTQMKTVVKVTVVKSRPVMNSCKRASVMNVPRESRLMSWLCPRTSIAVWPGSHERRWAGRNKTLKRQQQQQHNIIMIIKKKKKNE